MQKKKQKENKLSNKKYVYNANALALYGFFTFIIPLFIFGNIALIGNKFSKNKYHYNFYILFIQKIITK